MKFPRIDDVAAELRKINANIEGETDVRLQVYDNGHWAIRTGSSDYDQDHRGYWGASLLPGVVRGEMVRFSSIRTAKELLAQVKEHYYIMNG